MKLLTFIMLVISSTVFANENSFKDVEKSLQAAMDAPIRTEKEKLRDKNRRPVETLKFFGLQSNMKVIELLPGGGWYTKLLAPVLAEEGEFYVAMGTKRVVDHVIGKEGMEFINLIDSSANIRRIKGTHFNTVDKFDFGDKKVDMVLTFRNYHNFDTNGRKLINEAVFKALKPGGIYAVVDHTRRHMQKLDNENFRRVDPVLAIKEIQNAGFILVDYSNLHYRADDELKYEVGRKTVTGNTDRFTLKFIKPKQ